MKTKIIYSVFNSVTGDFLGSVQKDTLEDCRSWKRLLAKSLGLAPSGVYGRYRNISIS